MSDRYQYYDTDYHGNKLIYEPYRASQSFVTTGAYTLEYVTLGLYYYNAANTIYVEIYLADANHKPTGAALVSKILSSGVPASAPAGVAGYTQLVFDPTLDLDASTEYCIVLRGNTSYNYGHPRWQYGGTGEYSAGVGCSSTDSGANWTAQTYDFGFECWGSPIGGGWGNIAKVNGITATNLAKVRGIAVASIAKRRGIAV